MEHTIWAREKDPATNKWTAYFDVEAPGRRNSHLKGPFKLNIKGQWIPLKNTDGTLATDITSAKEARDRYDAAQEARARGVEVPADSRDGTTKVSDAVGRFMRLHRNDRPKTVQQYRTALDALNTLPKNFTVKQLATEDALDKVLQSLEAEGYAKKTIETRMGIIFSLLKSHAGETGVLEASKLVSVPKPVTRRPKEYSNEEIDRLFSNMDAEEYVRYLFFLTTGCREQEVMYATWDDVDCDNQTYRVTGEGKEDVEFEPKSRRDEASGERFAPLSLELCELLEKRKKAKDRNLRWVFPNADGNPDGHFLRKFKVIAKKAELNCGTCETEISKGRNRVGRIQAQGTVEKAKVTCSTHAVCEKHYLHRLRKTAATRWLRAGFDLETIRVWLGHKSLAVTQIYLSDENKQASKTAQEKFNNAMKVNRKSAA